jgi:DNA invertase Pin-like site-specific DNA recombinase
VIQHIFEALKRYLISVHQGYHSSVQRSCFDTPLPYPKSVIKSKKVMTEKQYVAYYRVSTKRQKQSGLGLESQKAIIEHYAKKDKAKIVCEFTEVESGRDIENRKILQDAIKYCLKNKYTLIVAKLDRLSRDVEHIFQIKKKLGNQFKSCDSPSSDSLTLSIFAGLAQRERELVSIRTKAAFKAKKAQGHVFGNPQNLTLAGRKLGMQKMKELAATNKHNKMAARLILRCRDAGLGFGQIAKELNENGFTTPRGKQFYKTTVKRLYEKCKNDAK